MIQALRELTLRYCQASEGEYECIITHGATSAIQLVADCFPWGEDGEFHYTADNHTSVVGIQGSMISKGSSTASRVTCVSVEEFKQWYSSKPSATIDSGDKGEQKNCLFAFPMESNFSGTRYSLDIVSQIQDGTIALCGGRSCFRVLVDAAKASSSFPPDLSTSKPDFIAMSYYKIFGYPTGLGALLVHRNAMKDLKPRYFGGGTVDFLLPERNMIAFKDSVARFENGTLSFLSIPAAVFGFAWLEKTHGIPQTIDHSALDVALHLAATLHDLSHVNGYPVCAVYGQWSSILHKDITLEDICCIQGPTVTFNVFDAHGQAYGGREIETAARLHGIYLRSGSLCNAGALRHALQIDPDQMAVWRDLGYSCSGTISTLDGVPTGAIRASFGYASTRDDAEKIARFISENFRETTMCSSAHHKKDTPMIQLDHMFVYPIKSCPPQAVNAWKVDSHGLEYDRHWKIIHHTTRKILKVKSCPNLCKMIPRIDLERGKLTLVYQETDGKQDCMSIPLNEEDGTEDSYRRANEWISGKLNVPCSLVRVQKNCGNFTNQSHALIMYSPSIQCIRTMSGLDEDMVQFAHRMRPNMIFSPMSEHGLPFDDDAWSSLTCTTSNLTAQCVQACTRCDTVCIDTQTGAYHESMEPLKSIIRAKKGFSRETRFSLGSLFDFPPSTLHVGSHFIVQERKI